MTVAINYRFPFWLYCFVSWIRGTEHLHGGITQGTIGPWTFVGRFCVVYKRVLKLVQGVLHVYKKALKLVQGAFARVQKGIERCKNGLVQWTIWAWSDFKSFLRSEQLGFEVTSSHFYAVNNLGLKLEMQEWHWKSCMKEPWCKDSFIHGVITKMKVFSLFLYLNTKMTDEHNNRISCIQQRAD